MSDENRRSIDPLILEIHGDIKTLIKTTSGIEKAQEFHARDIADHELRIKELECLPEKKKEKDWSMRSLKVGVLVSLIGVPLTIIGLILTFVFK